MTKAALFTVAGELVCTAHRNTPVIQSIVGYEERDMQELWQLNCEVIAETLVKSNVLSADIVAIGCTGHGKGLYLWGDGKPAYNAIASTDSRAECIVDRWNHSGITDKVRRKTMQPILSCQPVSLLRWLKEYEPEVYQSIRIIFECKDYIRFMLTGEAYAEVTDYSGTSLMNLQTKNFDTEILELLGIPEMAEKIPPIAFSTDICGYVSEDAARQTGLLSGTPVCGGMFDIDACAIAMNMTDTDKLSVITGTWSINEYISTTPVFNPNTTKNSLFCIPDYYLIEESSATSAGNLEWYIHHFLAEEKKRFPTSQEFYQFLNEQVDQIPLENDDLLFVPYLYGSKDEALSSGSFTGLNHMTSKFQMARAIYEGVVFSHYEHYEKLLYNRKTPKMITIAGGAVNSAVWVQMFADVFDVDVEVIKVKELGALGAAMAGAVAIGIYSDYNDAAQHMISIERIVHPDENSHIIYQEKYKKYKYITSILK